jgi:tetratricopeptide (TPR) repeat protein
LLLALTVTAAYLHSFSGAFVYDDLPTIVHNPSVQQFWASLKPVANSGLPTGGRPLVNFTLALNYAAGGTNPFGYHLVNLAIHLCATLALFGLIRRTLILPQLQARFAAASTPLAACIAALWAVHPLQTESVTYIVQRAESLMGLFYLLTLYCFVRGVTARKSRAWFVLSFLSCLFGMACKEVMVSAPLIVGLYDRTFVSGSLREAWKSRRRFYIGLGCTWVLLAYLVMASGDRGGTAGFTASAPWWQYTLAQARSLTTYLHLIFWPHPLIFDYGTEGVHDLARLVFPLAVTILLLGATLLALMRAPEIGFLGVWLFSILAPSSSVVPVATEVTAEHRLYLSLAAALSLVVLLGYRWAGPKIVALALLPTAIFIGMTYQRNKVYQSELSLWKDTVAKRPGNARAHFNLGELLGRAGNFTAATDEYRAALGIKADFASAHSNLSNALLQNGDLEGARAEAETALRLNPNLAEARNNLGNVLYSIGRPDLAEKQYTEAIRLQPDNVEMRNNLGSALAALNRLPDAIVQYEEAVRLDAQNVNAHFFLGNTFARMGNFTAAAKVYQFVLHTDPNHTRARDNLARVQALSGAAPGPSRQ